MQAEKIQGSICGVPEWCAEVEVFPVDWRGQKVGDKIPTTIVQKDGLRTAVFDLSPNIRISYRLKGTDPQTSWS